MRDDAAMDDKDATKRRGSRSEPEPATASGPWSRNSRRVAYENAWITIWHDEVTRPDGARASTASSISPTWRPAWSSLDDEDRVLLVGQHRYTLDAYSWEIPEGGVPAGETALDGARRELPRRPASRPTTGANGRVSTCGTASATSRRPLRGDGTSHGTRHPTGRSSSSSAGCHSPRPGDDADGRITDAMTVVAVERWALLRALEATRG